MFLKHLELQGFKTFATRTEFIFETGITAIVGPNGSGKSNIADAVRWVLGEQSPRPLRIKRSDDIIFAGSSARARVGMAEVSITLDNSSKWLPVDFGEVTITRRAYRSGESEYLVNKSRVRLRDVVDMLLIGNIGQNNYTVVGQGAIDAALSLRPEERRQLFEEAADIKRYQIKRNDAIGKLDTTEANLVRASDLMTEIAPRLRTLQEQAQRAKEQDRLLQDLRSYLAAWYVHRWNEASDALRRSMSAETEAQAALGDGEAALSGLGDKINAARQREEELRQQLGAWHRQSSELHTQAEALERRLAVARANLDAANRQQQEILDEILPLDEQRMAQEQIVAEAKATTEDLEQQHTAHLDILAELEKQAAAMEAQRLQSQKRLEAAETEAFQTTSAIASTESSLAALAGRRQSLANDIAQRQAQMKEHHASAAAVRQAMTLLERGLGSQDAELATQTEQRTAIQNTIATARKDSEAAQAALSTVHDERRVLELRLDTLSRLHESLAGYDAGVRSVLNAARSSALSGIVGTVASLLRVPPEYEAAIGAALGSHEQDIVTDTWQGAEAAVEHLRQTGSGRATFLPLDVILGRPQTEKVEGAIGWAADLVQVAERHRPVFSYLLGRVLLVNNLATARRILGLPSMRSVSSIATLAGDIVRPGGAITGGSPSVRSSGLLERERELADLPPRIESAKSKERSLDASLAETLSALRRAEGQLVALDGRLAAMRSARAEQAATLLQRQREHERWQQEIAWVRQQEQNLARQADGIDAEHKALVDMLASHRQRQRELEAEIANLRQDLAGMAGSETAAHLAEARTSAALSEQELAAHQTLLSNRRGEAERLAAQIAAKERRAAELAEQANAIAASIEEMRTGLHAVSEAIAALQQRLVPAEIEVDTLERDRAALIESDVRARTRFSALERARSQAVIEVQRARNELGKLQAQIEAEEGLGVKGYGLEEEEIKRLLDELAVPVQLSLGMPDTRPAEQQTPAASPELLKRRVDGLRGQLRHLGLVNPNAVAEYEEALQRYAFLASQSEDLEKAVRSLRSVIAELDELMRTRFETTFEAVGREFRRYFTTLFGGGSARLTLTDPDDLAETGIEIVAQPPGKRLQSLALLSGGERALTATALLFAILTVNPTPFCVLDEVDAALDDANVTRFCDALRGLAQRTQFIVITYNKGTMEIASSLYGVSMAADSTSQVISLKLEDIPSTA